MKKFNLILLLLFCAEVLAQQNFTLYPMQRIPQSNLLNPAQTPDCKWHLGIPGLNSNYFHYSNGGFNFNQILDATEPLNGDTLTLNLNKVVGLLSEQNYIALKAEFSILSGGFKTGNHYFHFSATEKAAFRISLPKDLFRFVIDGNGGANLGETFHFRFKTDAIHYREYAMGYAYNLEDKLSIGGRFKVLKGFNVLNTKTADINITTDKEDYSYLINANVELNTASTIGRIIQTDSGQQWADFDFNSHLRNSKNSGVAFDLGFQYQFNDKLSLSGSVIDMGYIHWNKNAVGLKSHDLSAEYKFDGIHVNGSDTSTDFGQYMEDVADTLKTLFKLDTVEQEFGTPLSPEFFIGAQYSLNEKLTVGGLFYGDFYNRRFYPGLTVNLLWKASRAFNLNITNTFYNRGFLNPGIGGSLNLGPVQMYGVMDNFLLPFAFGSMKSFSIRAGMNLTFGREDADGNVRDKHDKDEAIPETTPESI